MKREAHKKTRKRMVALLLAASLAGGAFPVGMNTVEAAGTASNIRGPIMHEDGSATWDTIYFGNYWQNDTNGDGKADKKDQKEPIRWRVLSVENGEALLLSEKLLMGGLSFIEKPKGSLIGYNWENSDMRSRLNGYDSTKNRNGNDYTDDSFLNDAFSESEQEAIPVSGLNVVNGKEYDPKDPSNVQDKVFLLSSEELSNPDYGFVASADESRPENNQGRKAWYTQYALDMDYDLSGLQWEDPTGEKPWWTRTVDESVGNAVTVSGGSFWPNEMYAVTEEMSGRGVRPAIRLKLSDGTQWSDGGTVSVTPQGEVTGVKPTSPEITVKAPVSMDEAKHDVIAALAAMKMTNSTTIDEILASAEESVAWGVDIQAVGDLDRTPATRTEAGQAKIQLRITFDSGASDIVAISWGIMPLDGFSEGERKERFNIAERAIHQCIWDYPVSNNTTKEEMTAALKAVLLDEWCITLDIPYYRLFPSNSFSTGGIEASARMLCGGYYNNYTIGKTVPVTETKTEDERLITEDIDAIRAALDKMKVTNETTQGDITKVAKASVKNGSKVEYLSGTLQKTNATYTAKGKLSIMYKITRNQVSREIYKRWEIPKLTTSSQSKDTPKAGTSLKSGKNTYKVLKKGSTVAFTKTKSTSKTISIPATLTYGGIKYKVTEVSKNALKNNKKVTTVKLGSNITKIGASSFQGCKKLKNVTISSKQLKTVGKKAFSGIQSKAKIKVPSSKKKTYKRLLKGTGLSKKAKIV